MPTPGRQTCGYESFVPNGERIVKKLIRVFCPALTASRQFTKYGYSVRSSHIDSPVCDHWRDELVPRAELVPRSSLIAVV